MFLTIFILVFSLAGQAYSSESSPRALVHLLDYLAQDYDGAVRDGKVISQSEFVEQKEFSTTAAKLGHDLPEINSIREVTDGLDRLQNLVAHKALGKDVSGLATQMKNQIIKITGLPVAPTQWPSLAHGAALYTQNCVTCHGQRGDGQGPAAAQLNPKPANFFDPERMNGLSPFKSFNAIRIGVPGTAMAAQSTLSDKDVWDVAFYVMSLRHQDEIASIDRADLKKTYNLLNKDFGLEKVAVLSDGELPKNAVAILRTHSGDDDSSTSLAAAATLLDESMAAYRSQDFDRAKARALMAYLEGVEPIEPRLKASDPALLVELESRMALVRSDIEGRKPASTLDLTAKAAHEQIRLATLLLNEGAPSPWLTFLIASGILLREGFEAVLIVIAFLGVIRASGAKQAAKWVHGGWIVALACGVAAWFFSGWLMAISGAQRELMEGVTSIAAVSVLLYMGFWLHRTTEIGRWTSFVNGRVKTALQGKNLIGLSAISFMAVFREAFETVLFLRALWLEGGMATKGAMLAGVIGALALILFLAWIILRSTTKIPIRKLFDFSSSLMTVLAVILVGKGLHSLQETGILNITASPLNLRVDLIGFYPTLETTVAQLAILAIALSLWFYGKKPSAKNNLRPAQI